MLDERRSFQLGVFSNHLRALGPRVDGGAESVAVVFGELGPAFELADLSGLDPNLAMESSDDSIGSLELLQ